MSDEPSEETDDPMEALVGIVAVATLPLAALAAIFVGGNAAAVVAIVGWFLLVPVLGILSDHVDLREYLGERRERDRTTGATRGDERDSEDDALQRLRERYAAGEIDDVEFERRLERLLETEGVEVPEGVDPTGSAGAGVDLSADRQRERERE
ncbi:SHOCT domain-containing protein [Halosimplex pelagicum]|uniref:SHOCT domain-containing protein n=1 Tax=Halosimplex pelagicum TaxID=869886 RepID=A0A7D5PEB6_9EURY|nr:SHOCT domain-containing protein [Halosimplex pelagicum]QLH84478.1 SHOCT domain-containing protein [Halosimplex pelagicum]